MVRSSGVIMARRRSGKKIDFVHWTGFATSSLALAAGTAAATALPAQHEPETLLRIRGSQLTYVDGTQAPGGFVRVGVGMILVPEGTGTTVLWSPVTDADAPWIWVDHFSLGYEEYVNDTIDAVGAPVYRSVIDNKAMRIIRNQEVQCVIEQVTVATAMAINNVVSGRILSGT